MYKRQVVEKELAVKKSHFIWQMRYLKENKFSVISMDEAYGMLRDNRLKGRHIVLSFDDGYRDYYQEAYPILNEYQFPSILYLVPGYIDSDKVFWWDQDVGASELLSWEQLKECSSNPLVTLGSHTMNHYDLDTLNHQDLGVELVGSKKILQEQLDCPVRHFSYPRGIYSKEAECVIKEHFDTGVLIFNGIRITDDFQLENRTKLKRIPVQRSDGKYLFIARIKGWLVGEEILRYWICRIQGHKNK